MTLSDHEAPSHRRRLRAVRAVAPLLVAALGAAGCGGSSNPAANFDVKPYVGHGHVAQCTMFKNQADAQAVLRADSVDPNGLDRDGDGIACPKLPGPKDTKPVHRDFITDKDGAPVLEPLKHPKK